jgi:hypothetical protein
VILLSFLCISYNEFDVTISSRRTSLPPAKNEETQAAKKSLLP